MTTKELRKQYRQWAGTDISKDICDYEGYMQGCWKGRWTKDTQVRLFVAAHLSRKDGLFNVATEGEYSAKELHAIYLELKNKDAFERYAGFTEEQPVPDHVHTMLHLASSLNSWNGFLNR